MQYIINTAQISTCVFAYSTKLLPGKTVFALLTGANVEGFGTEIKAQNVDFSNILIANEGMYNTKRECEYEPDSHQEGRCYSEVRMNWGRQTWQNNKQRGHVTLPSTKYG